MKIVELKADLFFIDETSHSVQTASAFMHYKVRLISDGQTVLTAKRSDGKIDVIASQEIAAKLQDGTLCIKSKNGKVKEIATVQIVTHEEFTLLQQAIAERVQAVAETSLKVQATPSTSVKADPKDWVSGLINNLKTVLLSNYGPERADRYVLEESDRIKERMQKKEQQVREEQGEVIRQDIRRFDLKRASFVQEERLKKLIDV